MGLLFLFVWFKLILILWWISRWTNIDSWLKPLEMVLYEDVFISQIIVHQFLCSACISRSSTAALIPHWAQCILQYFRFWLCRILPHLQKFMVSTFYNDCIGIVLFESQISGRCYSSWKTSFISKYQNCSLIVDVN